MDHEADHRRYAFRVVTRVHSGVRSLILRGDDAAWHLGDFLDHRTEIVVAGHIGPGRDVNGHVVAAVPGRARWPALLRLVVRGATSAARWRPAAVTADISNAMIHRRILLGVLPPLAGGATPVPWRIIVNGSTGCACLRPWRDRGSRDEPHTVWELT